MSHDTFYKILEKNSFKSTIKGLREKGFNRPDLLIYNHDAPMFGYFYLISSPKPDEDITREIESPSCRYTVHTYDEEKNGRCVLTEPENVLSPFTMKKTLGLLEPDDTEYDVYYYDSICDGKSGETHLSFPTKEFAEKLTKNPNGILLIYDDDIDEVKNRRILTSMLYSLRHHTDRTDDDISDLLNHIAEYFIDHPGLYIDSYYMKDFLEKYKIKK